MGQKYTEAKKRAIEKYQSEKTATITIRMSKEKRAVYDENAAKEGKSLSKFIQDAVEEHLKNK